MDRVVIVTKETPLEELVRTHQTESAARFALESEGNTIDPYLVEDATYQEVLLQIRRQIPNDLPVAEVRRELLSSNTFRPQDLVVVCGPDGLFANAAKYVGEQPVLTVNPGVFGAGVLMLYQPSEVGEVVRRMQAGKTAVEMLPFIKAKVGVDRVLWGINDIFLGRGDHVSARYEISSGSKREKQSSSGVLVSTGIGATGWMRSILTQAAALSQSGLSRAVTMSPEATSNELQFMVREPFPSTHTGVSLVTGRVTQSEPLELVSMMPTGGYIFSDGGVKKGIGWGAGKTVTITVGDRHVRRVVR